MSELRICTFNIRGLPWETNRIDQLAIWIIKQKTFDVINVQEIFMEEQRVGLRLRLEMYGWTCIWPQDQIYGGGFAGSGLAIAFRSPWHLIRTTPFFPFVYNYFPDSIARKGLFGATIKRGRTVVTIFNTHMQSDDVMFLNNYASARQKIRNEQEIMIHGIMTMYTNPILAGDLNQENSNMFQYIEKEKLSDTSTYESGEHLDHIAVPFKSAITCTHASIDRNAIWSDHLPVVANVLVK